jgi:protein ImuB
MYACLYGPGNPDLLLECARGFSPHIEQKTPDAVIFDVRGLESLYGPPAALAEEISRRVGVPANVAMASNPDAAMHAARGIHGITVIAKGKEAEALAKLPLNLLGGSPEIAELLHLWGVRTFADFGKLPPLGVAARLGEEGLELQRLARGEGSRQLEEIEDPLGFDAEIEPDYPIELLEPLAFLLSRLLGEVCGKLNGRALATNELRLRLTLENAPDHHAVLRLPVPMLDQKTLLRMLQLELNGNPPPAPVIHIHLAAEPVKPRRTQHGLFVPSSPEPEKLGVTVARVRQLVGRDGVGRAELLDSHRPDAFAMRPFAPPAASAIAVADTTCAETVPRLCLRRFRPSRYLQVLLIDGRPVRLMSPSVSGRVLMAKGPWRTSGEWWREDAWNRDEWDVVVESGGLYRIYQVLDSGRWFAEGVYD